MDKHIRYRSSQNIIDEIKYAIGRFGIKSVMFYDETIALNKKHLQNICEKMIIYDIHVKWEAPCRVDNIDREILGWMKLAGCNRIRYGVESGSPRILKLMNKRITLEQVKQAFKWTKEVGIETFAYFMVGYLTETVDEIKQTVKLACELNPDWVMFTTVTPLPKTLLFDQCVKAGIIDEDYWLNRKGRMPYLVPDADKWTAWAYRKFYLRVPYILKRLCKIRSFKDLKKQWQGLRAIL